MVYGPIVPTSCRHAALPAFSLSFYLAPRAFVPLRLAGDLSRSHPLFYCSLTLTRPCLSYSCRPFHVHGALSLYLASFHESVTLLTSLPAPQLSCGQRKGGEFGPCKQERISGRETTDSRKRQPYHGTREKNRDNELPQHTRAHDRLYTHKRRIYMQGRC